ncbi:hypothetical protein HPB48_022381 [Haemaphysalis longicornis]|uniref:Uncharacterized protein n=1 Tax=Haemaphysalis longicornis TaxID=44386 RepID=A0A9J6H030_HAELO|nr:hypothetical protein HPB48_022381 [Haemaphysalis longicornis]
MLSGTWRAIQLGVDVVTCLEDPVERPGHKEAHCRYVQEKLSSSHVQLGDGQRDAEGLRLRIEVAYHVQIGVEHAASRPDHLLQPLLRLRSNLQQQQSKAVG